MMLPLEIRQQASEIQDANLREAFCKGAIAYASFIGIEPGAFVTDASPTVEVVPPQFEEFWDAYDKKVGKPKAMKLWAKLSGRDKAECLAYIPKYKAAQPDKKYRKNPETFLRNQSWNDELIYSNDRRQQAITSGCTTNNGCAVETDEQERKYLEASGRNLFAGVD